MRLISVMIVIILLTQVGAARENSLRVSPEDFLYPLKIWMEKFSLNFVFNQTEKAQRMLDIAEKRLNEAEEIEEHKNRTKALKSTGKISIVQQSIIEASSSSGESRVKVSVVNGDVSVDTEGGNATVTRDGSNVTVVSVTNNSRQMVVVSSSRNSSSVLQSSSDSSYELDGDPEDWES